MIRLFAMLLGVLGIAALWGAALLWNPEAPAGGMNLPNGDIALGVGMIVIALPVLLMGGLLALSTRLMHRIDGTQPDESERNNSANARLSVFVLMLVIAAMFIYGVSKL